MPVIKSEEKPKYTGPCAFEQGKNGATEDLCKAMSASSLKKHCKDCLSPYKFKPTAAPIRKIDDPEENLRNRSSNRTVWRPRNLGNPELSVQGPTVECNFWPPLDEKSGSIDSNAIDVLSKFDAAFDSVLSKFTPEKKFRIPLRDFIRGFKDAYQFSPRRWSELMHAMDIIAAIEVMRNEKMPMDSIADRFGLSKAWADNMHLLRRLDCRLHALLHPKVSAPWRFGLTEAITVSKSSNQIMDAKRIILMQSGWEKGVELAKQIKN